MLWTTFSLKNLETKWLLSKSRSQWPSYDTRHCPTAWCTTTPSSVILHQIA